MDQRIERAKRFLPWVGAPLFAYAFWHGYVDRDSGSVVAALFYGVLVIAGAAASFVSASSTVRAWSTGNVLLAVGCAFAMFDSAANHNPYSGMAALLVIPLGAIAALSITACSVLAWRSTRR